MEVEHVRSKQTAGCELQKALKVRPMRTAQKGAITYLGIADDEPGRFGNLTGTVKSPLVDAGWTERHCREWCEENGLLSPIYTDMVRGGCWFCPNQSVRQLRLLRKRYPEYWALMLKWDKDSPVCFVSNKRTVLDFERRFALEDQGLLSPDDRNFKWDMLGQPLNYRLF